MKIFRFVVVVIIILLIYYYYQYYNKYYKFNRTIYVNEGYIIDNKIKYTRDVIYEIDVKNVKNNKPFLFQTYYDKSKIPIEIYENIKEYAPEYKHIILDDSDIITFLNTYYNDNVTKTFNLLKLGAHKADLARYCLLYIYGGLYMDIKVELIKPLSEVFNKGDDVFYSVESTNSDHIHQGIIKTPPNNPLFLSLIDYIVNNKNPSDYLDFCRDLYIQIKNDVPDLKLKMNTGKSGNKYYLLKEKCSNKDDSMCYDGFDRYGYCCFIWDGNVPVIKSRRSSYPWK